MTRVHRGLPSSPEGPCAITIGNFDGVHIAHQRVCGRVVEVARANGWIPSVLTFDPHPTRVIAPERCPKMISTLEERIPWFTKTGIEQIVVLPFDRTFSLLSPEDFVRTILVEALEARAVLVGENFRFGNRQAGDVRLLSELGERRGFLTEIVPGVEFRGHIVSSSAVRTLVEEGNVSRACRLLGRPYALTGQVVSGHGIGSKQTVPTLNLATPAELLPATGVYVTSTEDLDDHRRWRSITNIGYRPTFGGDALTIETFLLQPLDAETPKNIRVDFRRRIRAERKFEDADSLKRQIFRDVARAQAYFRRTSSLE